MGNRLYNELKYTVFAALTSIIAAMLFYLFYDILEFTEVFVQSPSRDTAQMMVFFLTLSCFCIIAAALSSSCRGKFDVFVVAIAPYAVTSAICSIKEYPFLLKVATVASVVLIAIRVRFLFSKRKPLGTAKNRKLRFRIASSFRFAVKIFITSCAAIMLALIIKSAYKAVVDRYEEYKWWNEHAGMELGEISDESHNEEQYI